MAKISRLTDDHTMLKIFIIFHVSKLFFSLNNHKTPKRLLTVVSSIEEFSSINWAWTIREFFVNEFNKIETKFAMKKQLSYINRFLQILLVWFLEHTPINRPRNPNSRPQFLRWGGNTDIFYSAEKAITLFANIKEKQIFHILETISQEEAHVPVFTSGNIVITRADIDQIITNEYLDNDHIDAFALLLSEKIKFIPDMYQSYLYISPMQRISINIIYKEYQNPSKVYVQYINKISVKESNLLIIPIIHQMHWTLLVGKLKEKYENYTIHYPIRNTNKFINELQKEMPECFESDVTKCQLYAIRGVPTQTNNYDCGMFVCKYMKKIILRSKVDWTKFKLWQKAMPRFRVEFGCSIFLSKLK
ncbi:hypothetical protein M5K25_018396 [Dendrobium thyrsiflorum]|uniref:Ubiquitin-like protease family profile domain-containing protein n=1 Tax=Dendrobium thyrsiflorum TaxID=117978 RepID=A0ABD0UIW7_DENTH